MLCQTCSTELQPGQRFCANCGALASTDATTPIAVVPPAPPVLSSPPPTVPPPARPLDPLLARPAAASAIDADLATQANPATPKPKLAPIVTAPVVTAPIVAAPAVAPPAAALPPTPAAPAAGFAPPQVDTTPWQDADTTTGTFNIVEQTNGAAAMPEQWTGGWSDTAEQPAYQRTTTQPAYQQPYADAAVQVVAPVVYYEPSPPPAVGRGSVPLGIVAILAGVTIIVGAFLTIVNLTSDAPIAALLGDYKLNDLSLGTNLQVAFVVAGLAVAVGGVLAVLGKRFGAGLAAGVSFATLPFVLVVWAATDQVIDPAEAAANNASLSGLGGTYFQAKLDIGFWLVVAGAGVALIAGLIALIQSGRDGRPPLNVVICAAGAVAAVLAGAGQLVPAKGSSFGDQFDTDFVSAKFVYGRLAVIAIVIVGGIVGFLRGNRWGIGLAIGSITLYAWQWVSSIAEAGNRPLPPAFGGGTIDGKPHIATTIGVVAVVLVAVLVVVLANQPRRAALAPE